MVSRMAIWLHVAARNMMVCPSASEQMLNWILFSKMLFIWIIYKPYVSCNLNQEKNGNVFEFFPSLWFFEVCTYGKVLMQRLHLCSCLFSWSACVHTQCSPSLWPGIWSSIAFWKKDKTAPELALSFQFQSRHHPQCSILGTCFFLKYGCGWHKSFVALSTNQSSLIKKLQSIYLLEWEFTLDFTFTFCLASIKKYPLK